MTLCSLCQNIPWETLPSVPPDLWYDTSQHPYMQICYQWPKGCRGYMYHQSLEGLQISATTSKCDLCRLVLKQVEPCQEPSPMNIHGVRLWEFWIMKRGKGGDGFWVMSLTDETYEVVVVAAFGLCVRDGDPLESTIRGRPVEKYGGTLTVMSRVQQWVNECDEHPSCSPGETRLPSRVIDVGISNNSPHVRLYETAAHDRGKYISLSYCWGDTPGYTTTKATLTERKRRIVISDLPKTYEDTIQLTRHLGIRYLWIDSICICQDDHKDWEQESARMLSIYRNAYLTVSASRAKDSSQGLFGERPAREYVELQHTSDNLRGQTLAFELPLDEEVQCLEYILMLKEPLSDRAWCLQERVGSRRTVFYGSTQLFFECNEGFQAEDGLFLKDRFESVKILEQKSQEMEQHRLEDGVNSGRVSSKKSDILFSWHKIVDLYGQRKLTYASDKLLAISGLASVFARLLDDEYVAGLWRSQLIEGLLWQSTSRRVQEYRSPSWSWASTDGRTAPILAQDYYTDRRILAKVLNISVDLKGANPYGEVINASIEMRAPMERLYIATEGWDPHKEYAFEMDPKARTTNGTFKDTDARFDFDWSAEDGPQEVLRIVKSLEGVDTFALILTKGTDKDDGNIYYWGLIIAKVNSGKNFQRLGTITFKNEALGQRPEERPEGEFPTIVLV